ncbi:hypothetical protein J1605_019761 [Eschrichtius robustus]|uniref:Uncharacterized protein n=1 Tax=Eschrichtius robustus TaxID=9764 RepID=A0AB34HI36_ESCRO|nr:hypothetical protein J1605_019761 [Eschrichtius robustus]
MGTLRVARRRGPAVAVCAALGSWAQVSGSASLAQPPGPQSVTVPSLGLPLAAPARSFEVLWAAHPARVGRMALPGSAPPGLLSTGAEPGRDAARPGALPVHAQGGLREIRVQESEGDQVMLDNEKKTEKEEWKLKQEISEETGSGHPVQIPHGSKFLGPSESENSLERQQVNSAEAGLLHSSFEEKGFSQVSITLKKTLIGEGKLDINKKVRICDLTPTVTHQRVSTEERTYRCKACGQSFK